MWESMVGTYLHHTHMLRAWFVQSRGVYETPGGSILVAAHRGIESVCLDRCEMHLKDQMMPQYAEMIYNGFWYSPERIALQAMVDKTQEKVEGSVRLKLYKVSWLICTASTAHPPHPTHSHCHVRA
jgi:argininosuccinate synthase